jgi:hypothetical protein
MAVVLGAASGYYFGGEPSFSLVGALLGFLVGRIGAQQRPTGRALASGFLNAHLCLFLSAGAWVLGLAVGYWVSVLGLLRGEGASLLLMFIVLPAMVICWLIGGPIALLVGRNAVGQIEAGARPQSDMWLARTGMVLSRAMNIVVLVLLVWLLSRFVQ